MAKLSIFVSATFVLIFLSIPGFASPQDEIPNAPVESEGWPQKAIDEDMSISKPPKLEHVPAPRSPRYYPYQQALLFRVGFVSEAKYALDRSKWDEVIGFQYLFPKFLSPKLEAGADLHIEKDSNGGRGHIFAGARWIVYERSYFRPSVKLSLDHFVESKEGLGTLGHLDNYYARASGTIEYTFRDPWSVRIELEGLAGFKYMFSEFTLGISRGW